MKKSVWLVLGIVVLTALLLRVWQVFNPEPEPMVSEAPAETVSSETQEIILPNIVVFFPRNDALVGPELEINGIARVFENVLNYRLTDANGLILVEGYTTADAPDVGQFGSYSVVTDIATTTASTGTLEVFSESAMDGSEINKVVIPLRFKNI